MEDSNKFLPLYAQARKAVRIDTEYFLNKIRFDLTEDNIILARAFADQIMSRHDEIIKQHNWAFNTLVKTVEKSCFMPPHSQNHE